MRIKQRRTVSKQIPSYKFLLDETYKICTNIVGYDKSNVLIAKLSDEELNTPLDFSSDEKKKEAHWKRDKNLRDILQMSLCVNMSEFEFRE